MAKLGSFGAAMRELDPEVEKDTFDFFGTEFTVVGVMPAMVVLRLGALLAGELNDIEANAVTYQALKYILTKPGDPSVGTRPDSSQFDLFEDLATERMCDTNELIRLLYSVLGYQISFPTEQPPTSPDGQLPTGENSNSSASDTPASGRLRSVDEVLAGSAGSPPASS